MRQSKDVRLFFALWPPTAPVDLPSERILPEPSWLHDEAIEAPAITASRFDTLTFPRTAVEAKEAVAAAAKRATPGFRQGIGQQGMLFVGVVGVHHPVTTVTLHDQQVLVLMQ